MCKYFTITLSIVSWISFNFGCLQPGRGQETVGRKYAILVGVKEYDRNQLKNLPFAENDVSEMAEILTQSGFRRVELLTQAEGAKKSRFLPLAKTIRETIAGVLEDREKDDLVLIAFAGHGVQFKGEKENYFCPMDAVLTDRSTLISLSDVYGQLDKSKAGTKLLLVDACRNDPLAGNARAAGEVDLQSQTRPQLPDPPGGVAAFFSCSAGQRAFEDEGLKHGVFFHHVILGLKGEAKLQKREEVTWDSLVAYVKSEVPDTVKTLYGHTTKQVPENKGELRGQATLIRIISTSVPTPAPRGAMSPAKPSSSSESPHKKTGTSNLIKSESTGMKLTRIPEGTFMMGASDSEERTLPEELPQHKVQISRQFYMGIYEVTQDEYAQVMGTNPSKFNGETTDGLDTRLFPVENISWYDAIEFCNKLSEKDGLIVSYELMNPQREDGSIKSATVSVLNGNGYRLPTEAEWEYACRATTTTPYNFGTSLNGDKANAVGDHPYMTNNKGPFLKRTTKVGSYAPNKLGLFDMHGNVLEMCFDVFDSKAYSNRRGTTKDPIVTSGSETRVGRGGGALHWCFGHRSARRWQVTPGSRDWIIGLRVIRYL